jgi:hypothetical protein
MRKMSPPLGFGSQTVQPVASRHTDWAITYLYLLKVESVEKNEV